MEAPPEDTAAPEGKAQHSRLRGRRFRLVTSLAGPLVIVGVLAYVLAAHGDEIGRAVERASITTIAGVTLLALLVLLARSEEAVICLTAMDNPPSRLDIHAASSFAFLVSTLNHYVASPVRATLLQRLDPPRAPTIPQMILVDGSTYLIEGLLAAALLVISAGALKLQWWMPVLAVVGALVALAVALTVRRRFHHHALFGALAMLAHSRYRLVVVALTVIVFTCQIGRTLIVLDAAGLHPTLLQAVATFIAGGVLSNLLAGPGAGTAAAPLIIFGRHSIGAAAATGLILSVTALLAAALYTVVGGPTILWRLRRRRRGLELRAGELVSSGQNHAI